LVDRKDWNTEQAKKIKDIIAVYKKCRDKMLRRTVLKNDAGVLWESGDNLAFLFSFKEQPCKGEATDVLSNEKIANGKLLSGRVYQVSMKDRLPLV
ncbi:MAG: hypothetical protein NT118_03670, partial [Lentisphaerae bacterium]|nr:hypothetical protein [Lentisphaerota bacterium]